MVFAWQGNARWRYFADDLPVYVCAERHKGSHVGKGREISILIRLQDRDHAAPLGVQARQEFGGHALPVHDHSCDLGVPHLLFITCQKCGDTCDEMLVAAMGGDKQWVALLVVQ